MIVATIVEGHGEVSALPVLLRSIWAQFPDTAFLDVKYPIRVRRDRFLNREDEFSRIVHLAGAHVSNAEAGGFVLIVLDADDDCPATLGARVRQRAVNVLGHQRVSVVLANREFEAWFIASARALNGVRGLVSTNEDNQMDPDRPRDAKGWLASRMPNGYSEVLDQPAFSAKLSVGEALNRSRSFRKLYSEIECWRARKGDGGK